MKASFARMTVVLALGTLSGCAWGSSGGSGDVFGRGPEPSMGSKVASAMTDNPVTRGVSAGFQKTTSWMSSDAPAAESTDNLSLARSSKPGADLYVAMAEMQEQNGAFQAAADKYEEALKVDPKSLPAMIGYARLCDRQDNFVKATQLYRNAIKNHPKSATAHNDLGLCLARQKKYSEAITALQTAVQLEPKRPLYRNNIATVLAEVGRMDEAITHLTAVHGEAKAHYNLGYMLHQRKQDEKALQQFQLALRANPNFPEAQMWVAQLSAPPARQQIAPYRSPAAPQVRTASLPTAPTTGTVQALPTYTSPAPTPQPRYQAPAPSYPTTTYPPQTQINPVQQPPLAAAHHAGPPALPPTPKDVQVQPLPMIQPASFER